MNIKVHSNYSSNHSYVVRVPYPTLKAVIIADFLDIDWCALMGTLAVSNVHTFKSIYILISIQGNTVRDAPILLTLILSTKK